jgi:MFS family permease
MVQSLRSWIVVGISFVNIAVAFGLNFSFSVFLVAISEEFNWSRASVAGAFSLSSLILGIGSWPTGGLADRFGPRKMLMAGSIILSFATIASGWIEEVWHLYLFVGIFGAIGICNLGWVPHSVLISNWFVERRGTMVGIAFSGMGIGILAIGPAAQYLISSFGWRTAYKFLGLLVLVLLLPLNYFLRDRPNGEQSESKWIYLGQKGGGSVQNKEFNREGDETIDWTLGRSMMTLPFWSIFFSFFLIPIGIFPVVIHQVAYIIDHGYSKMLAASVFGAVGLLSGSGRLFFGTLSDQMGRVKAVTISFIFSIVGIIILLLLPSLKTVFWLYFYAVLFGIGFGARGPIITAMLADMYKGKNFGSIYGFINVGNGVGGALGPWLGGYLYDLTGSYRISFLICIPILVLACILFWMAVRLYTNTKDEKL